MTILLDTQAFIWFVLNEVRLSPLAKARIEDPSNIVLISPASYWEIAIKISIGKYRLTRSYEEFWRSGMSESDIAVSPIQVSHTSELLAMPFHHKDPFDRLIVAQAMAENIPLISSDAALDAYGIQRIW